MTGTDEFTAELENRICTEWAGRKIVYYDCIDSTNAQAKILAEEGAPEGTLVLADAQTAGRGRKGRGWESPSGINVYLTLVLKPKYSPDTASMVTLVMALAVKAAITEACGVQADIKWPNDIVVKGKKTTGILTEMSLQGIQIGHVLVGVGINVGKRAFPPELEKSATTLEAEAGEPVSRTFLVQKMMEQFERYYALFLETEDLSLLQKEYNTSLVNLDREVRVLDPAGEYTGIAKGINKEGELLVQMPDGEIRKVYAGEVSVRGIYGYV